MLYNLNWLNENEKFPPACEETRLKEYKRFEALFELPECAEFLHLGNALIENFDNFFKTDMLLGYQRLATIKIHDMVVGAPPSITKNKDSEITDYIQNVRDSVDMDVKNGQAVIDHSRFGVAIYRIFNDDLYKETKGNFCIWNPNEWFPVFMNDGTKRIKEHVLAWRVNEGTASNPIWYLDVQIHPAEGGAYIQRRYTMDSTGVYVGKKILGEIHQFAGFPCLIQPVFNLATSTNPYGTSDYKIINDLIFRATNRLRSILAVLDAHANPSMTGPVTLLSTSSSGELVFQTSKFYAVSPGEEHPEYLTWDGKLDSSFKALEILLNEIYTLSEMGEAFLGNTKGTGQAISGTAMRYKVMSPLSKARRVSNAFTLPLKKLVTTLILMDTGKELKYQDLSIIWEDSLPKDPREQAELGRLKTGAPAIDSLSHVLMEDYDMNSEDADALIKDIIKDQKMWTEIGVEASEQPGAEGDPAAPPNPAKKGSLSNPGKTGTKSRTN